MHHRGVIQVFFSVMNGSFALGNALPHLNSLATARGASATIFSVLKRVCMCVCIMCAGCVQRPRIDPYSTAGARPPNIVGRIHFKSVMFAYPLRKDVQVLRSLSFALEAGASLAIVGSSGCGKSTIVNLLLRFYDAAQGRVRQHVCR
jgi:ABC-type multidrug transport system fused ATPase/permease subunit